jgi:trimeric autotransporter adhesin
MSSNKSNLRLIGALVALAALALAVSCQGFFPPQTLTAITISPATPVVEVGNTTPVEVYGTYSSGSTGAVTSGISWSSDTPSVASFSSPTSSSLEGVSIGTATITASVQGLSATASATVYLGGISAMTVSPTSASLTGSNSQLFTFTATAGGSQVPITTDNGGILTITPPNPDLQCSASGNQELCSGDDGQTSTITSSVVMSYPGTTATATATVTLAP